MIAKILINSIVAFASLFLIAKILGKKQIAELTFTDYVVGISLGSISAEWAIDSDTPWFVYAIAIAIFFSLSLIIDFAERKSPKLKKLLKGSPIVLISDGKIDYINLKRSKLDVNALLGMCRNGGYFDIDDIAFAVFETSGELSIMPKSHARNATVSDLGKTPPPAVLITPFIIDGNIYYDALQRFDKDKCWLLSKLQDKDIKRILLATYNPSDDSLSVKYKNDKPFAKLLK